MSITITGMEQMYAQLGRIASHDKLEQPMQRGVYRLQAFMQDYPPAPTHSSYIRTGTLGRRWTTRIDRSTEGLVGTVGNNTKYAPFVQSQMFQRRVMQRIGWRTDQRAVEENRAAIVADFQQAVNEAIRG